ncbi:MAG: hypothetical protein HS116_08675 [Planctomycetes bacterium]|nr:hypothetical protein [Planctomycetota bacterium]
MSRTGALLLCGVAFALACCPGGVSIKRGGPCGQALCPCPVQAEAPPAHACCAKLRLAPERAPVDGPALSASGSRWALQEVLSQSEACAVAYGFDYTKHKPARADAASVTPPLAPTLDIPTPPPRG